MATIPYDNFSFGLIRGKNVSNSLLTYAEENNMDMIVLSMRKRNYLQRLFDHSVTREMAYRSSIPVLAFHA
jgi:nucleotide-binding universal stress UspA family protein